MASDRLYPQILSDIEKTRESASMDRAKRRSALVKMEQLAGTRVAVFHTRRDRALTHADVLPFTNMLKSIGKADSIDLVVTNPGGDGTAAETILDLCRQYCTQKLRVVVPLYAKSAATLLALGADEIVMGQTSELGPIDAQIPVIEGNAEQQVSAEHFLRARDEAKKNLGSGEQHEVQAAQIQLSLMNPAFLKYCDDLMDFARKLAGEQMRKHMFAAEHKKDPTMWNKRIDNIVKNLTSTSKHLVHGRMINANQMKADKDLQHLKVTELAPDAPYWTKLNELLIRNEILTHSNEIGKIIFARDFQLVAG